LGLWSTEVASYNGEFVSFRNIYTAPSPAREPHPPIWVGGTSTAALRPAVTYGDAWHPNNAELSWLHTEGLPALRSMAAATGRPTPALSPRMRLRLAQAALDWDNRRVGEGNLAQVLSDLDELAKLGAEYIVLDTNPDHPAQRRPNGRGLANARDSRVPRRPIHVVITKPIGAHKEVFSAR
jgi:alkanesulfonate monooxygenase SsuD/methylene tetrahydromethanopterin reductase-like flavin-dependent oxidoreductase (luciferase family)